MNTNICYDRIFEKYWNENHISLLKLSRTKDACKPKEGHVSMVILDPISGKRVSVTGIAASSSGLLDFRPAPPVAPPAQAVKKNTKNLAETLQCNFVNDPPLTVLGTITG
jgi:hypothetical protein